jgi:hypothetical protein
MMNILSVRLAWMVLTFSIFACKVKSKPSDFATDYDRVEIYCWCYLKDEIVINGDGSKTEPFRICDTIVKVRSTDLIIPKDLLSSLNDTNMINNLKGLIFHGQKTATQPGYETDSRFLLLFRKNTKEADTLIYDNFNRFSFNNKYLFSYSFDVMDSVRKILRMKLIDCKAD